MRTFGLAIALAAQCAVIDAFEFATFFGNLAKVSNTLLDTDFNESPSFDFKITTRHDVKKKLAENKRRIKPLTKAQRHTITNAHHNMMAQRARLGMPLVGAGNPQVGQNYSLLNSFSGGTLRVLKGLTYNKNAPSKCYDAFESFFVSFDTGTDILRKIYLPAYWSEGQVQLQDTIAISSGIYVDCNADKALNTITHLISTEGVSELGGRLAGAAAFELKDCWDAMKKNSPLSKDEKGYRYGRCISVFLNYTI